jgi:hypothetical protein
MVNRKMKIEIAESQKNDYVNPWDWHMDLITCSPPPTLLHFNFFPSAALAL